jgi:hypothetical protein
MVMGWVVSGLGQVTLPMQPLRIDQGVADVEFESVRSR